MNMVIVDLKKKLTAVVVSLCVLLLFISCGYQDGNLQQISDTNEDTTGIGITDPTVPVDNPGNNPGDDPVDPTVPETIYSIVKLWELTETCRGSSCDPTPYLITLNLDSKPDEETGMTYATYLEFTETGQARIFMKILGKSDPYKILNGYSVGSVVHCAADDETYTLDYASINVSNIGSGTIWDTETSLVIRYSNGDRDTFAAVDNAVISGYTEKCLNK